MPFEIQKGISPDLDSLPKEEYALILVDDVANSGKTFLNAIQKFFNTPAKSIQCLALIDRSHKLFPIHCDFVGLHLSTTLQEHIYVQLEENASLDKAWLT